MAAIITITTDFGISDGYVAAMKGSILSVNPEVKIIDITHQITPQNILEASFVISTVYRFFPPGTIHMVVVDPGVGTKRKAIILRTLMSNFVAPDNGVLSHVISDYSRASGKDISTPIQAVTISNPRYWRTPVSSTFHGRDIFAPVAAYLSLGIPLSEFGTSINSVTTLPLPVPLNLSQGCISGEVIHIDNFGNLITDITEQDLPDGNLQIIINNTVIEGISKSYQDKEGPLVIIGSGGYLEIAVAGASAAKSLGGRIGDEVRIAGKTS
jgi:S-adenosylmethionine hydrolase